MSGMQLTKQIKARHPQVKIVIVTNHGEREFLAEALASKADGFFLKETVSGEEFSALIESISSEMGIDSGGLGVRSLSGAPPSDQPEAQSDEEEGNGQRLTKVGLQFA
jgi:DNA-binding NarL/FixJ family response regulator